MTTASSQLYRAFHERAIPTLAGCAELADIANVSDGLPLPVGTESPPPSVLESRVWHDHDYAVRLRVVAVWATETLEQYRADHAWVGPSLHQYLDDPPVGHRGDLKRVLAEWNAALGSDE